MVPVAFWRIAGAGVRVVKGKHNQSSITGLSGNQWASLDPVGLTGKTAAVAILLIQEGDESSAIEPSRSAACST
jgi:hypothetical protein